MASSRDRFGGEIVVLHDQISYRDPDWEPTPGQPAALLFANRGTVLGGEDLPAPTVGEVARLEKLGAVSTDKGTLEAKMALSGQRPDARLSGPYLNLSSPTEAVTAMKASHGYLGGASLGLPAHELAKLSLASLKTMAEAFGLAGIAESDSKEELIGALKGDYEGAEDPAEAAQREQLRDEAQVGSRAFGGETGRLGTNVASGGVNAETGERTATEGESRSGRRRSAAQRSGDDS